MCVVGVGPCVVTDGADSDEVKKVQGCEHQTPMGVRWLRGHPRNAPQRQRSA
jgi:hypothetical protein